MCPGSPRATDRRGGHGRGDRGAEVAVLEARDGDCREHPASRWRQLKSETVWSRQKEEPGGTVARASADRSPPAVSEARPDAALPMGGRREAVPAPRRPQWLPQGPLRPACPPPSLPVRRLVASPASHRHTLGKGQTSAESAPCSPHWGVCILSCVAKMKGRDLASGGRPFPGCLEDPGCTAVDKGASCQRS